MIEDYRETIEKVPLSQSGRVRSFVHKALNIVWDKKKEIEFVDLKKKKCFS